MASHIFNHPGVPILAVTLLLQMILWQFGVPLVDAALVVLFLSVLLPLVSLRARKEFLLAMRTPLHRGV